MYRLEQTRNRYREEPWMKPYEERMSVLKNARASGRKTAAFLYPHFDSSTFRYRGHNIAQTLEYSFRWSGACFQKEDMEALMDDLAYMDVLMVVRCAWSETLEEFLKAAGNRGIKLCYDVDDLIYHPKHMPSVISALGLHLDVELDFWFGQTQRHCLAAQLCDAVSATNGYLAGHLREDFGKPCFVLKNYLNWVQEEVSAEYFAAKQQLEAERPFVIGYFSGSHTHVKDLMTIMPQLEEFLANYEDAVFQIAGYMELPDSYNYLIQKGKIRFVPFQSFIGLQYEQAKVDVNIVPLLNNAFSNCKSELKYFESAIVGTVTCAAPVYSYAQAITDGENGYLCQEGRWLETWEQLYAQGEEERRKQQRLVRKRALEEYANKNQLEAVESIFDHLVNL